MQNKGICKYTSENGEKCINKASNSDEKKGYFANFKYCTFHERFDENLDSKNECVIINKTSKIFTDGNFCILKEGKCRFQYSDGDYCMFGEEKTGYCFYHQNNLEDVNEPIAINTSFLKNKTFIKAYLLEQSSDILEKLKNELKENDEARCDYKNHSNDGGWENCKGVAKSIICIRGNYLKVCDDHLLNETLLDFNLNNSNLLNDIVLNKAVL